MAADRRALPARVGRAFQSLGVLAFWLLVWQLASSAMGIELLLPGPAATARALWRAAGEPSFWQTAGMSVLRVLAGFAAGALAGALLAAATSFSRVCSALLSPMIRVIRATPVASFIILALLWLKSTILPGFIAALMVLPVVWGNLAEGIAKTDRALLEMGQVYGFSPWKTLRLVYLPSLRPWFRSACLTSALPAQAGHRHPALLRQDLLRNRPAVCLDGSGHCAERAAGAAAPPAAAPDVKEGCAWLPCRI